MTALLVTPREAETNTRRHLQVSLETARRNVFPVSHQDAQAGARLPSQPPETVEL